MTFDNRVVLITGTRKGIGSHLASFFAERGAQVIGMNRQPAPLPLDGYEYVQGDVGNEQDVTSVVREIGHTHGRLDIAINNAGIAIMNHALLMPADSVERIFHTNVIGAFVVSREAAKLMRRQRWGRIITMGSVADAMQIEGESAYAASKSALVTFTKILARELAPFNITCNVVAPTPIATDLIAGVPDEKINHIVERLAIKRLGRFEDVANVVEFFARDESDYITGQVIHLGGV